RPVRTSSIWLDKSLCYNTFPFQAAKSGADKSSWLATSVRHRGHEEVNNPDLLSPLSQSQLAVPRVCHVDHSVAVAIAWVIGPRSNLPVRVPNDDQIGDFDNSVAVGVTLERGNDPELVDDVRR